MVQALATTEFLQNAVIERHNLSKLNKTRIRFKVQLKKTTKSNAPKWTDVLTQQSNSNSDSDSDLVKVQTSEVGLKGIKVFKALDEKASELRSAIQDIQEWMSYDNGDWICPIDLAPIVWNQLLEIRDVLCPGLRNQLKAAYEAGYQDYQNRIEQFLSLNTWQLPPEKQNEVKSQLMTAFPQFNELEDYLQVIIGRPVIIPALSEQLSEQEAECLAAIAKFIQQYDTNLEHRLVASAQAGGEALAAQLLEDLSNWEPGHKPVTFKKKMEKHLKKVQVLLANADSQTGGSLQQMMAYVDEILTNASVDPKKLNQDGRSQLQEKMDEIKAKLLNEQSNLQQLVSGDVGLTKATVMNFKFR